MSVSTPTDQNSSKSELIAPPKKSWSDAAKAYLDSRVIIMLFLGFSAGIPILLIFSSLSLWLREAGIDRSVVTMFSWAALGYSFKFIWAPLIDALPTTIWQLDLKLEIKYYLTYSKRCPSAPFLLLTLNLADSLFFSDAPFFIRLL
jgi:hypothetical protein